MNDYEIADFEDPIWENGGRVHNWKNHISEDLREIWQTFTTEQKRVIARSAQDDADNENWDW